MGDRDPNTDDSATYTALELKDVQRAVRDRYPISETTRRNVVAMLQRTMLRASGLDERGQPDPFGKVNDRMMVRCIQTLAMLERVNIAAESLELERQRSGVELDDTIEIVGVAPGSYSARSMEPDDGDDDDGEEEERQSGPTLPIPDGHIKPVGSDGQDLGAGFPGRPATNGYHGPGRRGARADGKPRGVDGDGGPGPGPGRARRRPGES